MRLLQKLGAGMMVAGLFVVLSGGLSVRRGPDGTWVQVNLVHGVGAGVLLCGMVLTVIAAGLSRTTRVAPETSRESAPRA